MTNGPRDPHTKSEPGHLQRIDVRLPAHMGDQLKALARREHNGVSAVLRRLLTDVLAKAAGEGAR